MEKLNWPLMQGNITREDLDEVIDFLRGDPVLTQSRNVQAFEEEWSKWLGVKHSVFVNSGASANLITMAVIRNIYGAGEVLVPTITWVSDIASVLQAGMKPVFVDINPRTLCMSEEGIRAKLNSNTKAVFLTHVQGFNGLTDSLLDLLREKRIPLIEDACEAHGASHGGRLVGSLGLISNFSYYYAHHMSTIEGGMVCTNNSEIYQMLRMFRSHGLVRESSDARLKEQIAKEYPDLNPEFIFAFPAYNVRSTEINAVIGRNQLGRLNISNKKRNANHKLFLQLLDSEKYRTDFELEGSSNYAFNLVIREPDSDFARRVMELLHGSGVEFRRGSSGGGNQLRQPYLKNLFPSDEYAKYPETEHIHFYGFYIGNYPELPEDKIRELCRRLNAIE